MSIEAQRLVRAVGELTGPQKAVLAAYAAYADESGYCWAGTARIAFDTAFSLATVGRARRALIRRGWLKSRRRLGTSSVTRLNLARIAEAGIDTGPARPRRPLLIEFADPGPDARGGTELASASPEVSVAPAPPRRPRKHIPIAEPPAPDTAPGDRPDDRPNDRPGDRPDDPVCAGRAQSAHPERNDPLRVSGLPAHPERESVRELSGDLSLDARAHADSVGDRVPDRSERASETAPPTPHPAPADSRAPAVDPAPAAAPAQPPTPAPGDEAEAAAWALDLIGGLDYGAHRRPTRARATALALKLGVAHAGGLSQRDLRRHCRAALNQARRNGVAYLDGALDPDHLPIPTRPAPSPAPTSTTPAAPAAATTAVTTAGHGAVPGAVPGAVTGAGLDRPSGSPATATMSRAQAQAEIRRILTRRRPATSPEMAADAQTGPAAA